MQARRDVANPSINREATKQASHINEQPTAGGAVIDPPSSLCAIDGHRAIRGPQMAQEDRHLIGRKPEDLLGDELFVRAETVEAQSVKPTRDRVWASPSERVRR